jgi:integrase
MTYCQGVCLACYNFAARNQTVGECGACQRKERLKQGYCRLCWCQARHDRVAAAPPDARSRVVLAPYLAEIRHQQLFFADMDRRTAPPRKIPRRYGTKGRPPKPPPAPVVRPADGRVQDALFEVAERDYHCRRFDLRQGPPPDNPWLAWALYLAYRVAEARGWKPTARRAMQRTLVRLLAGHTAGETIRASEVRQVTARYFANVDYAIEIFDAMGIVTDDRPRTFDLWLQAKLVALAPAFRRDVSRWARTLHDGGPRTRPRDPATAAGYLRIILPALRDWSARYDHLREVTREDVLARLATLRGWSRDHTVTALRSLFTWAKRAKVIFRNPATRLRASGREDPILQPLRPDQIAPTVKAATSPQARVFVALAAVHAARPGQIRAMQLDDVHLANRRITIAGHDRPLDELTHRVLYEWLEHRRQRWPNTANPHLIVSFHTALGLGPVSATFLTPALRGLPATIERLRMDRQLEEAVAAGGDPLHLAAVFGISEAAAVRWATNARAILDQPDLPDAIQAV